MPCRHLPASGLLGEHRSYLCEPVAPPTRRAAGTRRSAQPEALASPIVDLDFPDAAPQASEADVAALAARLVGSEPLVQAKAVMVHGEFTQVWRLVHELRARGIRCFAATRKRRVTLVEGVKRSEFGFVRLREYL